MEMTATGNIIISSMDNNTAIIHNSTISNVTIGSANSSFEMKSPEPPLYIVLTSTLLYSLIFLVGILGNILVVMVIILSRSMKTTVNMYLMNLCVADVLVILVCMPTALVDIFTKEVWYFGQFMCKFVPFLENVVANASVMTILAISIERYRVVCHPLKVVREDDIRVWKVVATIWIISAGFSVPWLTIPELRQSNFLDGTPIQVCRIPIREVWQEVFIVTLTVLFFMLPCLVLILLNCHLCRVLNRAGEYDSCIHEGGNDRKRRKSQVANIIASIVSVFFICHFPFRVVGLWLSFADPRTMQYLGLERYLGIVYSTRVLFYLNHALNPVVYNFVSTKFRSALSDLFINTVCSGICNKLAKRKPNLSTYSASTRLDSSRKITSIKGFQKTPGDDCPGQDLELAAGTDKTYLDHECKVNINIEEKRVAIKFNFRNHPEHH